MDCSTWGCLSGLLESCTFEKEGGVAENNSVQLSWWLIEWVVQFTCLLWFHEACSPPHPVDQGSQGDSNSYWLLSNRQSTWLSWLCSLYIWNTQAHLVKPKRCGFWQDKTITHYRIRFWGGCMWVAGLINQKRYKSAQWERISDSHQEILSYYLSYI